MDNNENDKGHIYKLFPEVPVDTIIPLFAHRIEKDVMSKLERFIEDMKLEEDIDRNGIRNPLFAGMLDGVLSIVDGDKRWICAQALKLETVPIIVKWIPEVTAFDVLEGLDYKVLYVENFTEVEVE